MMKLDIVDKNSYKQKVNYVFQAKEKQFEKLTD